MPAAVRVFCSLPWCPQLELAGIANTLRQLSTIWPQPWFASFVTKVGKKSGFGGSNSKGKKPVPLPPPNAVNGAPTI